MDYLIGQIEIFPYSFTPMGWLPCNGQLCNARQYQELFVLLGTRYGGDGVTNFAVPNLQGLEPVPGIAYYISTAGEWPPRE